QHRERILVGRGGVQVACRRERVRPLRRRRHRGEQDSENETGDPRRLHQLLHGFLISTLSRAGAAVVTVSACRCSPNCGLRKITSCGPTVTERSPIGVSPILSPSIQTSAHGTALTAIFCFGRSILIGETFPAATCTTCTLRYASGWLESSSSWRPVGTMIRSVSELPSRRPF